MKKVFKNKTILVTGGCGSIGSEIVKQLLLYKPRAIRVLDNRETALFYMMNQFPGHENLRFFVGDIRDKERLLTAMEKVDIIFHAAALKHVPLCEYNPLEAVKTNVYGTKNVIEAALDQNVKKVVNISTDKVANPIGTMGATKLLAEKLIASAQYWKGNKKTLFSSVRFGNVVDSRGAVIDLFKKQIEKGGPITVTDPNMTRFIMSTKHAVNLVLETAKEMRGGEIFILKMPTFKLGDLSDCIINLVVPKHNYQSHQIKRKIIGLRPGEKTHENLMTEEEAKNALETKKKLIVRPQVNIPYLEKIKNRQKNAVKTKRKRYSSKDVPPLSKEELKRLIIRERLLD